MLPMDKASSIKKDVDGERKASQKKSVVVNEEIPDEEPYKEPPRPPAHFYAQDINAEVEYRMQFKVTENVDGEVVDLTPNYMPESPYGDQFIRFNVDLRNDMDNVSDFHSRASSARPRTRQSMRGGVGGNKQSIDEIMNGILAETITFDTVTVVKEEEEHKPVPFKKSFVKVTLRKSDFIELHSQISSTVLKGTPQGDAVEADNRQYDYLTIGKGKVRRRADNDAQTTVVLTNSRAVNTIYVDYATVGSYVSNFEMYDTLHGKTQKSKMQNTMQQHSSSKLDESHSHIHMGEDETKERHKALSAVHQLFQTHDFINAIRTIGRTLSSNQFQLAIERFRNFHPPDRCSLDVQYKYSMKVLFRLIPVFTTEERKAVADISFCPSNSDILAIGYGLFSFSSQQVPVTGEVYVWSVKNPGEPERAFYFDRPVTAICFSPYLPSLIAIGMYDGSVEVRDVADLSNQPIAVSDRSSSRRCSSVVAIRWIKQEDDTDGDEIDPFLSLSQDGSVTRYNIVKSPYLLGFTQMTLERIEGHPEGIRVPISPKPTVLANRHPQGLYITTHPIYKDIYYILTDEGCIHKCSINYQHQYLEVLKCHDGGVNVMEFSPWSPKLFLTCGNDWYVRIWIDGITRPIIELLDDFQPVHWAKWSHTHSTVIVSLNRSACSIWDLRRNILKPMGKHTTDSSFNTIAQFSNSGTVLAVGNERGNTLFEAINDMPFPPHFQYDELEKAIYRVIGNDQELFIELKSIGFFGYPNKKWVKT